MAHAARFVVWGQVQRVGYRAFAARQAVALGLRGWVRNRSDGAVEGLVAGEESGLAAFRQALERGPGLARVGRVEMTPASMSRDQIAALTGFRIEVGG